MLIYGGDMIPVNGKGGRENGGWIELDKKDLAYELGCMKGKVSLSIMILWDERMDATGVEELVGDCLQQSGEFPRVEDLRPCVGSIHLSGGDKVVGERCLEFDFLYGEDLVKAYGKAKSIFDEAVDWRSWVRAANRLCPRKPTRELVRLLREGGICQQDFMDLLSRCVPKR